MLLRRYALLALLAAVSCRETTAPDGPTTPAIRIESPVSGVVIGDTIVQLRGVAEAPGGIVGHATQRSTGRTTAVILRP
jgi:hypothetical protein